MEGCLKRSCPCLRALWDRLFKSEKSDKSETNNSYVKPDSDEDRRQGAGESAVYIALWAFDARDRDELSFSAGERFRIVRRVGDWWTADKLDSSGFVLSTGIVPHNYLERADSVTSQPWFFGKMNRVECISHLLTSQNKEGAFLVRVSENDSVGHVISVKVKNKTKHYKIFQSEKGFSVDESCCFPCLMDLVQYYQKHPLAHSYKLEKPCVRRKPVSQDLSHTTVDMWELPKDDFTLEDKLGSGYFADVYLGKWKNHTQVAIKILKNNESLNQKTFHMEVEVLKSLRHAHLISLFAVCTSSLPYYIITEYMEKGNLQNLLRSPEGNALDTEILTNMAFQVADGMTFLEKHKSIHRDLAARNVLVSEGYLCKVADFGLARFVKEPVYLSNDRNIPYKWTAPEAIQLGLFSSKSDVWSFGILLYEIYSYGGNPYPGTSKSTLLAELKRGYRMPAPPKCPQFISKIMQSCWSEQAEDRPNFRQLRTELHEHINQVF